MKTTRKKASSKLRGRPRARSKKTASALKFWTRRAERVLDNAVAQAQLMTELKKRAPAPKWTIEVEILGKAAMSKLNDEARGKKQPTDVLSFELPQSFKNQGLLGQLVICFPVLKAQAKALGHTEAQELEVLVVHGLLHLLGFDHEKSPQAAREMGRLESKILGPLKGLIQRERPCKVS
jgi:rRNA maturation RNase YbeY